MSRVLKDPCLFVVPLYICKYLDDETDLGHVTMLFDNNIPHIITQCLTVRLDMALVDCGLLAKIYFGLDKIRVVNKPGAPPVLSQSLA